jgi:hypothetical protein
MKRLRSLLAQLAQREGDPRSARLADQRLRRVSHVGAPVGLTEGVGGRGQRAERSHDVVEVFAGLGQQTDS